MTTLVTVPRRSTPSPAAKRTLDLVVASLMMVVALPLMGAIAVAIRLESPGPILFRQQRTGRDGRRFAMLKFRTMVANAEELKSGLAHLNVLPPPDFKIPDDPRTTRVGRLLRETSLDELPQLFNVLRGEMSLVGPRPTSLRVDQYDLWHSTRLEVAPGLTGLWQIHGRNTTSFDERLRLDIAYIDQRSVWMDLRILARTFLVVLLRTGK
jgi:lipopolysaccharide/colanic/teichoic acid biosynthesis glycosyltransferase